MSSHAHEPREEFVEELKGKLRAELRRQNLTPVLRGARWMPQSRLAAGFAIAAVIIGSMALGGGVVAATYEAHFTEQRDALLATFEQQLALAHQRLALAKRQLQDIEQRIAVGLEQKEIGLDMRSKVNEAEAEVKSIELDLAEIRATGREPMQSLSAPLVSGRDFVTERWRLGMAGPAAALVLEKDRMIAAQRRVETGIGKPEDVEAATTRIAELEAALQGFERKTAIRQTFLKGGVPGPTADLRGLEVENELRRKALTARIDFARRRVQDIKSRVAVGTANPIDLGEAELRLQELQLEMTKIDYDLLLIRKQLGK